MLPSKMFFDDFFDEIEPKKFDKMMKCDIYEEDNVYYIEMDVPGFKKDDINISLEDGYLKIEAVNSISDNHNKKYVRRERVSYSKVERSFYLGDVQDDKIKAEFKNGILKISVPKNESEIPSKKVISID